MVSGCVINLILSFGCSPIYNKEEMPVRYTPPLEYLIGPEDSLEVAVWRTQDLTREVLVRPDGMISLPLIGDIKASGLSATQLSQRITASLQGLLEDPKVTVIVKEVNSHYVYVLGEVAHRGKLSLKSHTTVLQAISLAGGFTPYASKNDLRVIRRVLDKNGTNREIQIPVQYDDLLSGDKTPGNFLLDPGDVLVVP